MSNAVTPNQQSQIGIQTIQTEHPHNDDLKPSNEGIFSTSEGEKKVEDHTKNKKHRRGSVGDHLQDALHVLKKHHKSTSSVSSASGEDSTNISSKKAKITNLTEDKLSKLEEKKSKWKCAYQELKRRLDLLEEQKNQQEKAMHISNQPIQIENTVPEGASHVFSILPQSIQDNIDKLQKTNEDLANTLKELEGKNKNLEEENTKAQLEKAVQKQKKPLKEPWKLSESVQHLFIGTSGDQKISKTHLQEVLEKLSKDHENLKTQHNVLKLSHQKIQDEKAAKLKSQLVNAKTPEHTIKTAVNGLVNQEFPKLFQKFSGTLEQFVKTKDPAHANKLISGVRALLDKYENLIAQKLKDFNTNDINLVLNGKTLHDFLQTEIRNNIAKALPLKFTEIAKGEAPLGQRPNDKDPQVEKQLETASSNQPSNETDNNQILSFIGSIFEALQNPKKFMNASPTSLMDQILRTLSVGIIAGGTFPGYQNYLPQLITQLIEASKPYIGGSSGQILFAAIACSIVGIYYLITWFFARHNDANKDLHTVLKETTAAHVNAAA